MSGETNGINANDYTAQELECLDALQAIQNYLATLSNSPSPAQLKELCALLQNFVLYKLPLIQHTGLDRDITMYNNIMGFLDYTYPTHSYSLLSAMDAYYASNPHDLSEMTTLIQDMVACNQWSQLPGELQDLINNPF